MVKEYVFEGSHARTIIRILNADENLDRELTKAVQEQRGRAYINEVSETELTKAVQKQCRRADANENLEVKLTKVMPKQRVLADANENLVVKLTKVMPKQRVLADVKENLDEEFDEEISQPRDLMHCLLEEQQKKERVQHFAFLKILKSKDVARVCKYYQQHRLNATDEYQMLVFFATEIEDDQEAEKLISDYVYRYGVNSPKARQMLRNLKFDTVVNTML